MKYSEVVGQENAKKILSAESKKGTHSASYIFAGQYGGGKTTLARIHAMAVNCEHPLPNGDPCCQCASCRSIIDGSNPDVKEIAAAEDNGVSMAKRLSEDVQFSPVQSRVKVYILDEAHALSAACWQVLLKVLEEAPEYTMFIMCTTEMEKVPLPVRSRSLICNFYKLQMEDIAAYLGQVAMAEERELSADACRVIAKQSEGSMRNALGILEKLLACTELGQSVELSMVKDISGLQNSEAEFRILSSLLDGSEGNFVRELTAYAESTPLDTFIPDLLSVAVDAAVLKAGGKVFGWSEYVSTLKTLTEKTQLDKLIKLSATLVPLVSKKETLSSVVMGEMFLAFKEINATMNVLDEERAEVVAQTAFAEPNKVDETREQCEKIIPLHMETRELAAAEAETIVLDEKPLAEQMENETNAAVVNVSAVQASAISKREVTSDFCPFTIEDIEADIASISKKEKLFKWLFLPAIKISYREQKLEVRYNNVDRPIADMLSMFVKNHNIGYIKIEIV
jgi:DNA polymerase-3 subunit gamma/tau